MSNTFAGWPVVASDPDWQIKQGPSFQSVHAPALDAVLVWSSNGGFTAQIDGLPELSLSEARALLINLVGLVTEWEALEAEEVSL
jgi:hypothetical protein